MNRFSFRVESGQGDADGDYLTASDPDVALAAKKVLEHWGMKCSFRSFRGGRTHISKGLLDKAKEIAERNIRIEIVR